MCDFLLGVYYPEENMCGCGGSRKNITTQTVEQTQQQTAPQPPTSDTESAQRVGESEEVSSRS